MPRLKLTDRGVKALKLPVKGRVDYFDLVLPAFGLRLSETGAATWFVYYRIDGKQVRDTIGRYPAKGLAEAREEARGKLRLVERHRDPRQEEARQRVAEAKRRAETFASVADAYHEGHLAKLTSGEELWQRVQDDLLPAWQAMPIRDIGRGAVMSLLDKIEKAKGVYARNRRLALIRSLFNFALDRELVEANVAARIKMLDEPDRDRTLTDAELAEVWHAAGKLGDAFGRYTRMLIATGQRRNEVAGMAWSEIAEAEKLWTIPAERMKARQLHEVPLPDPTLSLLEAETSDETAERGTYVFSTGRRGDRPVAGFNKLKLQLDGHILKARREADPKAKAMPDWRLHDIRRTVRSGLARLGTRPDVAERVLAHVPGGVEATYDRHEYRDQKRRALEAWAAHIERITNVVELRK
jgi:integrase